MSATNDPKRRELLRELEAMDVMLHAVMAGESLNCSRCGSPLVFHRPGSGVHPSVSCGQGCTEVSLTMAPTKSLLRS